MYDSSSYNAQGNMRYSMHFDRRKELVKTVKKYSEEEQAVLYDKLGISMGKKQ